MNSYSFLAHLTFT